MIKGKKAQGGLDLSSDTVIRVVLSVGAILLLTIFIFKIWDVFVPDTEEATKRNFEQLVASITNMEEGASFSSYPLFVDEDYAIVGYQSGVSSIGGTCTAYAITSPYSNTKPEQCGIGTEGCLCLCKKTSDFATVCKENDDVEQCATVETFGKDYSFTGGTYTEGGSCSFALVLGAESVQSVYLKKTENTVRICAKECDVQVETTDSNDLVSLLSSGGIITLDYKTPAMSINSYTQQLTYDSSSKKYTLKESTIWKYREPENEITTYTTLSDAVAYIKKQLSGSEATKLQAANDDTFVYAVVYVQAEGYTSEQYGVYTPEEFLALLQELSDTSSTEDSSDTSTASVLAETSEQNVLIIGDSQTMGTYGDTLYASFKTDGYTTNKYAVCGSTPSYFTEGISIISSACNAEYTYDDGSSKKVDSGNTPLLSNLIEKHTPSLVFVTFASNGYEWYGSSEETIQNSVNSVAEEITNQGATCYWAGPPQGPHYPDIETYQQFRDAIKESVENSGCIFIDSEEYTDFAFCPDGGSFGCDADVHFDNHGTAGKAAAETWAEGVYSEFASSLSVS
ncbi:SGNH/GDSL hydrolase family protein [Candidatus Woesearchaeota archaeon]|nr:SGNH/GDSL hydrolase family protein [Candidatus Woesearchaeota archaeon]